MNPKNRICIVCAALVVLCICISGCMTTRNAAGQTVVNTNAVIADAAVLQGLTTTGCRLALADPKVNGFQVRGILADINLVISGVISGANTNSPAQIAALINGKASQDAALAADIAPAVNFVSGLEQNALARYGSQNWAIIGEALLKAVGEGINAALQ